MTMAINGYHLEQRESAMQAAFAQENIISRDQFIVPCDNIADHCSKLLTYVLTLAENPFHPIHHRKLHSTHGMIHNFGVLPEKWCVFQRKNDELSLFEWSLAEGLLQFGHG